jgi:hypothetical protein
VDELDAAQTAAVHEWLDWILHDGDGWPQPEPVELPPLIEYPVPSLPEPDDHYTRHVCGEAVTPYGQAYERWLGPHDSCADCGWSPTLPLPSLDDTADRLVEVLGAEVAQTWALLLAERLGGQP